MEQVLLHPNYREAVIKVDGVPYFWDGGLCVYRAGYGPYATTAAIGDWQVAPRKDMKRLLAAI